MSHSSFDESLDVYLRRIQTGLTILDFSIFQEGQERDFSSVPLDQFYVPLRLAGHPSIEPEADE